MDLAICWYLLSAIVVVKTVPSKGVKPQLQIRKTIKVRPKLYYWKRAIVRMKIGVFFFNRRHFWITWQMRIYIGIIEMNVSRSRKIPLFSFSIWMAIAITFSIPIATSFSRKILISKHHFFFRNFISFDFNHQNHFFSFCLYKFFHWTVLSK